jgi:hypothetical protein
MWPVAGRDWPVAGRDWPVVGRDWPVVGQRDSSVIGRGPGDVRGGTTAAQE